VSNGPPRPSRELNAKVHVDVCARGHPCFDSRCSHAARLSMHVEGELGQRAYCLDDCLDRLRVRKARGEQIEWTRAARDWVESEGRAVVA
jgi:hypothetical protein